MKNGTLKMIQEEVAECAHCQGISIYISRKSEPYLTAKILGTYQNVYCKTIGDPKEKHIFSVCSKRTHESFIDIIVR